MLRFLKRFLPQLTETQLIGVVVTLVVIVGLYVAGRRLQEPQLRAAANFGCIGALAGGLAYWTGILSPNLEGGVAFLKVCLALAAMSAVYFETRRAQERKPIAERWKKFVGVTLGVAAIVLYFNGFKVGYQKFWHRHDQYHYYFGAKYFNELGYDDLYKCTVVALDELGTVTTDVPVKTPDGQVKKDASGNVVTRAVPVNLAAEVNPDKAPGGNPEIANTARAKKIRNLGGDNLLYPAYTALEHRELCSPSVTDAEGKVVSHFSPARWEQFKKDVKFFRLETFEDKNYWDGFQKDHGYNPPPVWTLEGAIITNLHDASLGFMQFLGLIDELFIVGMFAGIYWAFGWRVFAVSAVLWGCQASAPNFWTMGAFLRQDWLFWFVMSACFARKRWFYASGAAMAYATLLRVFPGLVIIGWVILTITYVIRHRRLNMDHVKTYAGGIAATVVLGGASIAYVGADSYKSFYKHTIEVHDRTPLTNHMGLRVMLGHRTECIFPDGFPPPMGTREIPPRDRAGQWSFMKNLRNDECAGRLSGRMQYVQDPETEGGDPFEAWKDKRNTLAHHFRYVGYGVMALSAALSFLIYRRLRSMWAAQALGQVWIILLSQLTSYYYAFIVISGPLTRLRRDLESKMFGFAAITQIVYFAFYFNDDKYTLLTYLTLGFCYYLMFMLAPKSWAFWRKPAAFAPAPASAGAADEPDAVAPPEASATTSKRAPKSARPPEEDR